MWPTSSTIANTKTQIRVLCPPEQSRRWVSQVQCFGERWVSRSDVCGEGWVSQVPCPGVITPVTDGVQGRADGAPTPPLATGIWWSSLETCSNLFTWGPTFNWYWHLVAATETRTVGKRAVRLLLECFLVYRLNYFKEVSINWQW